MATHKIAVASTNVLDLKGLKNQLTGEYPTDATVVVTLLDSNNAEVEGAESITASYVAGTTGSSTLYRAELPDTLPIEAGNYKAKVKATKGSSVRTFFDDVVAVEQP